MTITKEQFDPHVAWQPYQPTDGHLNTAQLRHLYRRAGFAASENEIETGLKLSPLVLVEHLVSLKVDKAFEQDMRQVGKMILTTRKPRSLAAWWLYRMVHNPCQLAEKTTFFWHGHFATSADKVKNAEAVLNQFAILRENALGSFEKMVQRISRDPAMLIYLDSTDNRKTHPNENYARELLELFCLGVGNYSEKDVQEIARCFTGCEVKKVKFRFNSHQHDSGEKSFLGARGNYDSEQAVKTVVSQKSAAAFIARKLVRFFVSDEPGVSDELLQPIAQQLSENGFQIGEVLKTILSSNLFYSDQAVCRKIRSPVEMAVSFLRTTGCKVNLFELANRLDRIGQLPFYPPNVKGWDGGRTWINSSTLIARNNLISEIVRSGNTRWSNGNAVKWLQTNAASSKVDRQVEWLLESLLPCELQEKTRAKLVELADRSGTKTPSGVADLICAIAVLPEFQLN